METSSSSVTMETILTSSRSIILVIWEYISTLCPSSFNRCNNISSTYNLPASEMIFSLAVNITSTLIKIHHWLIIQYNSWYENNWSSIFQNHVAEVWITIEENIYETKQMSIWQSDTKNNSFIWILRTDFIFNELVLMEHNDYMKSVCQP